MHKLAILNVGCNASHEPLRSPLFEDGTFEFISIPEGGKTACIDCESLPKYRQLRSFYNPDKSLEQYIPKGYLERRVHDDPEFDTFTYSDYAGCSRIDCIRYPRAANLKKLGIGDHLFFLARLVRWRSGRFSKEAGFYIIGYFEIGLILNDVIAQIDQSHLEAVRNNIHVKRGLERDKFWNCFWLFKGSGNSRRFHRAMPFTRKIADEILLDREGEPWKWRAGLTDLQVIGSHTRSCRIIEDGKRIKRLWYHVNKVVEF